MYIILYPVFFYFILYLVTYHKSIMKFYLFSFIFKLQNTTECDASLVQLCSSSVFSSETEKKLMHY